jgi:NADH dehydrogenase FAD-containing subunit
VVTSDIFSLSGYLKGDVTDARDKNVIVIGGGDTGVDCVATCVRQVDIFLQLISKLRATSPGNWT